MSLSIIQRIGREREAVLEAQGYRKINTCARLRLKTPLTDRITLEVFDRLNPSEKRELSYPSRDDSCSVIFGRINTIPNEVSPTFSSEPAVIRKIIRDFIKEYAGEEKGIPKPKVRIRNILKVLDMESMKSRMPNFDLFISMVDPATSRLQSTLVFQKDAKGAYCSIKTFGTNALYIGHEAEKAVIVVSLYGGAIAITSS